MVGHICEDGYVYTQEDADSQWEELQEKERQYRIDNPDCFDDEDD
jgi:hypothetical protein